MTKELTGQGGKGSVRRNEDTSKVLEGFTRIFGESKLDRKLREEREEKEAMRDIEDDIDEDELWEICPVCSGSGEGMYDGSTCYKCKGHGELSTQENYEDDYDDYT